MWKKFKFKREILSFFLVFGLILSNLGVIGVKAEGTGRDVSALLAAANPDIESKITVTQDGAEIPSGSFIDYNKPVKITAKDIVIPLKSDFPAPADYVKAGDTAKFILGKVKLGKGVKISGAVSNIELDDGTVIGKFTVKSEPAGADEEKITAELSFAKDKETEFDTKAGLKIKVWADFDLTEIQDPPKPGETKDVTVFGKTFKVGTEKVEIDMTKDYDVDYNKGQINWVVTIKSKSSLAGYKFADDLTPISGAASSYIPGTFVIKNEDGSEFYKGEPKFENRSHIEVVGGKVITYTFAAGAPSSVKVEFATEILDWELTNGIEKTNKAELFLAESLEKPVKDAEKTAKVIADWGKKQIKQKNGAYFYEDGDDYCVEWEIIFKGTNKKLKDVVIEDVPPFDEYNQSRLKFISAELFKGNAVSDSWQSVKTYGDGKDLPMPADHKYKLSDAGIDELDEDIKLHIVSKIAKEDVPVLMTFKNVAYITFGEDKKLNGIHWAKVVIDPKVHSILKKVKNADFSKKEEGHVDYEAQWEVAVENDAVVEGKTYVYDPIIYSTDVRTNAVLDSFTVYKNGAEVSIKSNKPLKDIVAGTIKNIKHNVYMNDFKPGKIESAVDGKNIGDEHDISCEVYELRYEGNPVGHLLEVSLKQEKENGKVKIYEKNADGSIKQDKSGKVKYKQTFSFSTKLVSPEMLVEKDETRNANIAALVRYINGKDWITFGEAWPYYESRMLKKQVLKTDAAKKILKSDTVAANVNTDNIDTVTDADGVLKNSYNKWDQSVLYRLSVNAEGIEGISKYTGDVQVKDEMPKSWAFDTINGKDFLIYKGKKVVDVTSNEAFVEAEGEPLDETVWSQFLEFKKEGYGIGGDSTSDSIKALFTFKKLDEPYVILIKAKLTDEALLDKDGKPLNKNDKVTNKADLIMGGRRKTDRQTVAYDATFIAKDYKENKTSDEKVKDVTWMINYAPYSMPSSIRKKIEAAGTKVELVDVLGNGMEIKADSEGNPDFSGDNFVLTEKWEENGNPQVKTYKGEELKSENVVKYDKIKRELRVILKNPKHEYDFSYITDITESKGAKLVNTVKIVVNGTDEHAEVTKTYIVKNSGASASWKDVKKANLTIYKVDGKKEALSGAKFMLTKTGDPAFNMEKEVGTDGKLTFENLSDGEYKLKETKAPGDDYVLTGKVYTFKVTQKSVDSFTIERPEEVKDEIEYVQGEEFGLRIYNYKKGENAVALELLKIDKADQHLLAGAKFRLTRVKENPSEDTYTTEGVTDREGQIIFENLVKGTYILEEIKAPKGYKIGSVAKFEIKVDPAAPDVGGEPNKIQIVNEAVNKDKIRMFEGAVLVTNEKETTTPPGPNPDPGPNPNPNPDPGPGPGPNPPTPDLPVYPPNDTPDPNDPGSPDEFVVVDEDGTPQGKYIKKTKPNGEKEYVIDEDGTPKGNVNLPKTGGTSNTIYYIGGAMLLVFAAGFVIRRKRHDAE